MTNSATTFIPSNGDLFYVTFKMRENNVYEISSCDSDVVTSLNLKKFKDKSYTGDVFKCVGRDDHALAAKNLTGVSYRDANTFVLSDVVFWPVGPEMVKALNLQEALT